MNIFINYLPQNSFNGNLNAFLSTVMLLLVVIIVIDSSIKWVIYLKWHRMIFKRAYGKEEALELDI